MGKICTGCFCVPFGLAFEKNIAFIKLRVDFEVSVIFCVGENVDFVLLGGDLFHENKPTRQSELKAFQVIRIMNC